MNNNKATAPVAGDAGERGAAETPTGSPAGLTWQDASPTISARVEKAWAMNQCASRPPTCEEETVATGRGGLAAVSPASGPFISAPPQAEEGGSLRTIPETDPPSTFPVMRQA